MSSFRALDEGSDEEFSYTRMAVTATESAMDAVSAYEASRRAAAAEAAAMRRGLVEARGCIEARQRAALAAGSGQLKQMSDRLSGYIQVVPMSETACGAVAHAGVGRCLE